ncbi:amylo-alpha-1,6-glucosidase [Roseomonas aerophila]|uniref:Amylo-alpha-1,6-glucosidase n=1 Tax=Teichococcus aerophilus TaxID=1224513 RepID=A0ABR7RG97_9PROT|nr:amylo-alpha-1,6-glucosidase [Pseudoroseomonas aerophila]
MLQEVGDNALQHTPKPSAEPAPAARTSLQERRPRTLKHGDSFGLFGRAGDLDGQSGSPEGLFHLDTRYLSRLRVKLNGSTPVLLGSALSADNTTLTCDLTNTDAKDLARGQLHLRRSKFIWNAACHERFAIRNFSDAPQKVRIDIAFGADFADLFEVRGRSRPARGTTHPSQLTTDSVTISYTGLDAATRHTALRFAPAPEKIGPHEAVYLRTLAPGEQQVFFLSIGVGERVEASPVAADRAFHTALRDTRRRERHARARAATVETSHEVFNDALRRATADLNMLLTDKKGGPYPYAGIPWFSTAFGRDALITAWQALWFDPSIALGVLNFLAETQADHEDASNDAEPGKILHEMRDGEMARLKEVPYGRYYGSVDSTPLFVMLAGAYLDRTGDIAALRRLWPNIEAALGWIEHSGDRDGDGFVEYQRRTPQGLVNQGWKDSGDSIFHADGTLAEGPIALVEMQAYVYAAWLSASRIVRAMDDHPKADSFQQRAETLREHFDAAFWDEELGTYVLALDGQKQPCRVRSSNAGHALFAGIAKPERARRLVGTLMNAASFSGWGIRTLAVGEARYNPMSYHNGSVWPHDNAMIAEGFARYGFEAEAARLLEGLFAAAEHLDLHRLPELFCGFPRRNGGGPTPYPVACAPQAWAAVAPLSLLASCLGLGFEPERGRVLFQRPVLPGFLERVVLRNLRVQDAQLDVGLGRVQSQVGMAVLERRGDIHAMMTS